MKHKDSFPLGLVRYKKCGKESSHQDTTHTKKKKKKSRNQSLTPRFLIKESEFRFSFNCKDRG